MGKLAFAPGTSTVGLPDGSIAAVSQVCDVFLQFVIDLREPPHHRPLIGHAVDVFGDPWSVPAGVPLRADSKSAFLSPVDGYDLYVMAVAISDREVALRFLDDEAPGHGHPAVGTGVLRMFSGPLVEAGYRLIAPICVPDGGHLPLSVAAVPRSWSTRSAPTVVDLGVILVKLRPEVITKRRVAKEVRRVFLHEGTAAAERYIDDTVASSYPDAVFHARATLAHLVAGGDL